MTGGFTFDRIIFGQDSLDLYPVSAVHYSWCVADVPTPDGRMARFSFFLLSCSLSSTTGFIAKPLRHASPSVRFLHSLAATTTTAETDVIVVGSGLGGLCCAATLAEYGYSVTVLEAHSEPGGAAHGFTQRAKGLASATPGLALARTSSHDADRPEAGDRIDERHIHAKSCRAAQLCS